MCENKIKKQSDLTIIGYALLQTKFLDLVSEKFISGSNESITNVCDTYLKSKNFKFNNRTGIFCNPSTLIMQMFFCAMWFKENDGKAKGNIKDVLPNCLHAEIKMKDFIFYLRNALAHNNFVILSNDGCDCINFWAWKNEEKNLKAEFAFTLEEFKFLTNHFVGLTLEHLENIWRK